jgi:hypothetical protein
MSRFSAAPGSGNDEPGESVELDRMSEEEMPRTGEGCALVTETCDGCITWERKREVNRCRKAGNILRVLRGREEDNAGAEESGVEEEDGERVHAVVPLSSPATCVWATRQPSRCRE